MYGNKSKVVSSITFHSKNKVWGIRFYKAGRLLNVNNRAQTSPAGIQVLPCGFANLPDEVRFVAASCFAWMYLLTGERRCADSSARSGGGPPFQWPHISILRCDSTSSNGNSAMAIYATIQIFLSIQLRQMLLLRDFVELKAFA